MLDDKGLSYKICYECKKKIYNMYAVKNDKIYCMECAVKKNIIANYWKMVKEKQLKDK